MFLPCSIKNAVAHVDFGGGVCVCVKKGHFLTTCLFSLRNIHVLGLEMANLDHFRPTKTRGVIFVLLSQNWYVPLFILDASLSQELFGWFLSTDFGLVHGVWGRL